MLILSLALLIHLPAELRIPRIVVLRADIQLSMPLNMVIIPIKQLDFQLLTSVLQIQLTALHTLPGKFCRDSWVGCQIWTLRLSRRASTCGLRVMEGKYFNILH